MKVYLVAGLGFGDEGKGSIVDALTRQTGADLVVRYNGGAQAAHHVVTDDGRTHCFSQFGSGTFAGARTHLSRFMMIEPLGLLREAAHLQLLGVSDPFSLMTIDPWAPILTPYHRAVNQLRELARGENRHGSCGIGIGELATDLHNRSGVLYARLLLKDDNGTPLWLLEKIHARLWAEAQRIIRDAHLPDGYEQDVDAALALFDEPSAHWLKDCQALRQVEVKGFQPTETMIFEGAQGVLLDELYGFHPHTTWSNCTFDNAYTLLAEAQVQCDDVRIGVTRGYATRHGAGPFPTEDETLNLVSSHHDDETWQGPFRLGYLDTVLLDYAVKALGGVDMLALTCLDQLYYPLKVAIDYNAECLPTLPVVSLDAQEQLGRFLQHIKHIWYDRVNNPVELCKLLTQRLHAPIGIVSSGPTASTKEFLYARQPVAVQ